MINYIVNKNKKLVKATDEELERFHEIEHKKADKATAKYIKEAQKSKESLRKKLLALGLSESELHLLSRGL